MHRARFIKTWLSRAGLEEGEWADPCDVPVFSGTASRKSGGTVSGKTPSRYGHVTTNLWLYGVPTARSWQ